MPLRQAAPAHSTSTFAGHWAQASCITICAASSAPRPSLGWMLSNCSRSGALIYPRAQEILTQDRGTSIPDLQSMLDMFGIRHEYYRAVGSTSPITPNYVRRRLDMGMLGIVFTGVTPNGVVNSRSPIRHWVVVEDILRVGSGGWLRIYNPFTNHEETYLFDEVFDLPARDSIGLWVEPRQPGGSEAATDDGIYDAANGATSSAAGRGCPRSSRALRRLKPSAPPPTCHREEQRALPHPTSPLSLRGAQRRSNPLAYNARRLCTPLLSPSQHRPRRDLREKQICGCSPRISVFRFVFASPAGGGVGRGSNKRPSPMLGV